MLVFFGTQEAHGMTYDDWKTTAPADYFDADLEDDGLPTDVVYTDDYTDDDYEPCGDGAISCEEVEVLREREALLQVDAWAEMEVAA
jgi:hypothetical protein